MLYVREEIQESSACKYVAFPIILTLSPSLAASCQIGSSFMYLRVRFLFCPLNNLSPVFSRNWSNHSAASSPQSKPSPDVENTLKRKIVMVSLLVIASLS
jgi:hypothetical protein